MKINISDNEYNFEVRIQKLKVPELEEILLYLWNQDPIIFDNFFSKSTLKSKLDRENQNLDFSSKFVNIFEDYYNFFKDELESENIYANEEKTVGDSSVYENFTPLRM